MPWCVCVCVCVCTIIEIQLVSFHLTLAVVITPSAATGHLSSCAEKAHLKSEAEQCLFESEHFHDILPKYHWGLNQWPHNPAWDLIFSQKPSLSLITFCDLQRLGMRTNFIFKHSKYWILYISFKFYLKTELFLLGSFLSNFSRRTRVALEHYLEKFWAGSLSSLLGWKCGQTYPHHIRKVPFL